MSRKTQDIKVTFGKQDTSNRLTYPTTAIILNGVPVGEITTYKEDISLSLTPKIKVTGYEVCIWGQDGIEDANFNTEDYASARSALAAAKRYAKETLSAPAPQEEETPAAIEPTAEEARVEEINAEVKQLRASAASVKDVEEEVLALERERADLLYGAETPAAIEPTEVDEALETRNPYYHLWVKRGDSWEYNSSWYDLRNRDAQRAALEARGLEVKSDFQACKDGVLEGKHNGAYVYDIPCNCPKCTAPQEVEREALPAPQEEEETPSPALHTCGVCGKQLTPCKDGMLRYHKRGLFTCLGSRQIAGEEVAYAESKAGDMISLDIPADEARLIKLIKHEELLNTQLTSWDASILASRLDMYLSSTEEGNPALRSLLARLDPPSAPALHTCGLCGKQLNPTKDGKLRRHTRAAGEDCLGSYCVAGEEVAWGERVARLKAAPPLSLDIPAEEARLMLELGYEEIPTELASWDAYSAACTLRTLYRDTEEEDTPALRSLLARLDPPQVEGEALVKALPAPVPPPEVEEEARLLRVTPPQVAALRALGYEVRSCKLRLLPSQVEGLVASLYAERERHTRGARRVYTSLIERVSKPKSNIKAAKGAPRARFSPGDLRIEYADDSAHIQLMQLVDAAESAGLISQASASALRASTRAAPPPAPEEEREDTGGSALARFWGEED